MKEKCVKPTVLPALIVARGKRALCNGEEQVIVPHRRARVSGLVTDSKTGQVISTFRVIPGYGLDQPKWFRGSVTTGSNGLYTLCFDEWHPVYAIRIEADGYEPATFGPISGMPGDDTCNFELHREDPHWAVQGIIRLPDGRPAEGAEVSVKPEASNAVSP